ncbi:MAG: transposase [Bryobacteraceae bacterium]
MVHPRPKAVRHLRQAGENGLGVPCSRVHRIAALLKRWLMGTHHDAVSYKHLGYGLDELTFRFNRRKSKSRGSEAAPAMRRPVGIGNDGLVIH